MCRILTLCLTSENKLNFGFYLAVNIYFWLVNFIGIIIMCTGSYFNTVFPHYQQTNWQTLATIILDKSHTWTPQFPARLMIVRRALYKHLNTIFMRPIDSPDDPWHPACTRRLGANNSMQNSFTLFWNPTHPFCRVWLIIVAPIIKVEHHIWSCMFRCVWKIKLILFASVCSLWVAEQDTGSVYRY